jgi:hypothetical protein
VSSGPTLASPLFGFFYLLAGPALLSTCALLQSLTLSPDALANFVFSKVSLIDNGGKTERTQDLESMHLNYITAYLPFWVSCLASLNLKSFVYKMQ